jgi:hypothetical protein
MVEPKEVDAIHVSVQVQIKGVEIRHGDPPSVGRGCSARNEVLGVAEGVGYKSGNPETCFSLEFFSPRVQPRQLMAARFSDP